MSTKVISEIVCESDEKRSMSPVFQLVNILQHLLSPRYLPIIPKTGIEYMTALYCWYNYQGIFFSEFLCYPIP